MAARDGDSTLPQGGGKTKPEHKEDAGQGFAEKLGPEHTLHAHWH